MDVNPEKGLVLVADNFGSLYMYVSLSLSRFLILYDYYYISEIIVASWLYPSGIVMSTSALKDSSLGLVMLYMIVMDE